MVSMITILHKPDAITGSHPGATELVWELEEEEDGDHDGGHHQADEGPVGEHDDLDSEWSLVLGRQHEDWKKKSVSSESGIPVFLVDTTKNKVEENEEESHTSSGSNTNVEGGVVSEDPLLVVPGELVEAWSSHCWLNGQVPGAELIPHPLEHDQLSAAVDDNWYKAR